MRKTTEFTILISSLLMLVGPIMIFASSPGSTGTTTITFKQETKNQPVGELEKVKLITATGIEDFVKDLNDYGRSGYRLEKSLSYGGEGPTQSYAAVLYLDAPNKYEYDWMSSPDKRLLEARLNFEAKKGFNFANAYPLTYCSGGTYEERTNLPAAESLILRLNKGDAFLRSEEHTSEL